MSLSKQMMRGVNKKKARDDGYDQCYPHWVSNDHPAPDETNRMALIYSIKNDNNYFNELQPAESTWKYAVPLMESELYRYGLGLFLEREDHWWKIHYELEQNKSEEEKYTLDELLMVLIQLTTRCMEHTDECSYEQLQLMFSSTYDHIKDLDQEFMVEFKEIEFVLSELSIIDNNTDLDDLFMEIMNTFSLLYPDKDPADSLSNAMIKILKSEDNVV